MTVEIREGRENAMIFRADGETFYVGLTSESLTAAEAALQKALEAIERFRKLL